MTKYEFQNRHHGRSALVTAAVILTLLFPQSVWAQTLGAQDPGLDRVSSGSLPSPEERIVAPGTPPLTEAMVNLFASFITYCYDIPLTGPRLNRLRASLVADWTKKDRAAIQDHLNALKMAQEVAAMSAGDRDLFKWGNYVKVVHDAHNSHDPDMKWLAGECDAVHPVLAGGTPPLTRPIAEATLYATAFMIQEARGISLVDQPGYKEQALQVVIANYSKLTPAQQQNLTVMPLLYGTLKSVWPRLTEVQRDTLRAEWRQQFGPGPEPVKPVKGAGGADAAFPASQQSTRNHYMHMSMMSTMMSSHTSIMRSMTGHGPSY